MSDKLIMEIQVDTGKRSILKSHCGTIVMIPFTGKAESELFNGEILPGGVDTQLIDVNGIKHMSARYMLEGEDHTGEQCKLYIENNGYFHVDAPKPFKTIPTFYTDSKALSAYFHSRRFRGEGHRDESGLIIKFFEM